jgi:hypothetical protein
MREKVKQRVFFAVAITGIILFVGGIFARSVVSTEIVVLGFVLLILGYAGLSYSARKERLQRVTPPQGVPISNTAQALVQAPLEDTQAQSTSPSASPISFDLTAEFQARRKRTRVRTLMSPVIAVMFLFAELELILGWVLRGNLTELEGAIALCPLIGILLYLFWAQSQGVIRVKLDHAGLEFQFNRGSVVQVPWDDPRFLVNIWETPAAVNSTRDPSNRNPSYWLYARQGSKTLIAPRILSWIPVQCFNHLMSASRAHGMEIVPGMQGVTGTMSERRTYRIGPPKAAKLPKTRS